MEDDAALFIELGAVLLALGLLGILARRLQLSPVPLYLLAGLGVGTGGFYPLQSSERFISVAADLGLLLLLLTLGLEFSSSEFAASLRRHGPSGALDFVLNAGAGFVAGLLLGFGWSGAFVLAGVTWISSSGIVARVLADLDRLANRETPSVLSILVIEDIAMAVYLPILAVILIGGSPRDAILAVVTSITVVTLALVGSRRFSGLIGRAVESDDDEQVMLRVFGITLVVAGLTQLLDASAAVGAFLVGLALNGRAADRARQVLSPLRDLFAAAFFLAFGMEIDPGSIGPVLPAALALAVVTALTKGVTGWYAAARDGASTRGRVRAGLALVPRGEFSIVIAGLAVAAGIADVGPVAAAYVLLLAVLGPVLARLADPIADRFFVRPPPAAP